jgi:5-methylcytosine-specific restriction endonuclease McrA
MKERILELRNNGKTYDEIRKELGCSKSTIAYHCSKEVRENFNIYQRKRRSTNRDALKKEYGGKCTICGYDKCLGALHFHHLNPKEKINTVSNLFNYKGKHAAHEEAKKCVLLCSNCHNELHEKLISL